MTLLRHGHALTQTPVELAVEIPVLEVFLAGNEGTSVRLSPEVDLETLSPRLSGLTMIEVEFPSFADGRGFSIARQLRRLGFEGDLVAAGPLIPDQYVYALQCGFDAVKVDPLCYARQSEAEWREALDAFDLTYQRGYAIANGPSTNIFDARKAARAKSVDGKYTDISAQAALQTAIAEDFKGEIAMVTTLETDAVVLLHMIAQIDKTLPVIFTKNEDLHKGLSTYLELIVNRFGLSNVQTVEGGTDVEFGPYKAHICEGWGQGVAPVLETTKTGTKLRPLLNWTNKDVIAYMRIHDLPPHPHAVHVHGEGVGESSVHYIDGKWVQTVQEPTTHADYI